METMLIGTLSSPFRKARSVNQTSATFVQPLPTGTEPRGDAGTATGDSIFQLGPDACYTENGVLRTLPSAAGQSQNGVIIVPYGVATDNQTFSFRVIGWRVIGTNPSTWLWIPVVLGEFLCTADSTLVGVAGKEVVATELFCDTITLVTGNANISNDINSPADGESIAHVVLDLKGFTKLQLSFETGSSATSCNALIALL